MDECQVGRYDGRMQWNGEVREAYGFGLWYRSVMGRLVSVLIVAPTGFQTTYLG
jgi:hypothetical protein